MSVFVVVWKAPIGQTTFEPWRGLCSKVTALTDDEGRGGPGPTGSMPEDFRFVAVLQRNGNFIFVHQIWIGNV